MEPRTIRSALRLSLSSLLLIAACRPGDHPGLAGRAPALANPLAEAPVIRKSTVVAFWLRASDTLPGGKGADLLDDFRSYTARVAPALEDAGIAMVATTADSIIVDLTGGPRRVIGLNGLDYPFGYVLVEPGYPESILTGVSTDDELLDEVNWYFRLDDQGNDSLPGQEVSARGPPGRAGSARPPRTACAETRYSAAASRAAGSRRRCIRRHRES